MKTPLVPPLPRASALEGPGSLVRRLFVEAASHVVGAEVARDAVEIALALLPERADRSPSATWAAIAPRLEDELACFAGPSRTAMVIARVGDAIRAAHEVASRAPAALDVSIVLVGFPREHALAIADATGLSCAYALDLDGLRSAVRRGVVHEGVVVVVSPDDAAGLSRRFSVLQGSGARIVLAGASDEQRALAARTFDDAAIALDAREARALGAALRGIAATAGARED